MLKWLQRALQWGRLADAPLLDGREACALAAHSSFMRAANERRLATYRANSRFIKGVRWLATLDSETCIQCSALDGQRWTLDGRPLGNNPFHFCVPPLHPGCRCVATAIPRSEPATGPTIGARASSDGPIARSTTFDDFLKRQSPEAVARLLGKERAALFLSGELGLRDFITPDARERTPEELHTLIVEKARRLSFL